MGGKLSNTYISSSAQIASGVISTGGGVGEINLMSGYAVVAGTWVVEAHSSSCTGGRIDNATASATGNEITTPIYITPGTYSIYLTHFVDGSCGICKIGVGATVYATLDTYSAGSNWNVVSSATGVVIAETGVQTLRIYTNSKNGASSNYRLSLIKLVMARTA